MLLIHRRAIYKANVPVKAKIKSRSDGSGCGNS